MEPDLELPVATEIEMQVGISRSNTDQDENIWNTLSITRESCRLDEISDDKIIEYTTTRKEIKQTVRGEHAEAKHGCFFLSF